MEMMDGWTLQGDDGGVSGPEYDDLASSTRDDEDSSTTGSQGGSSARDDVKRDQSEGEQFHVMVKERLVLRLTNERAVLMMTGMVNGFVWFKRSSGRGLSGKRDDDWVDQKTSQKQACSSSDIQ